MHCGRCLSVLGARQLFFQQFWRNDNKWLLTWLKVLNRSCTTYFGYIQTCLIHSACLVKSGTTKLILPSETESRSDEKLSCPSTDSSYDRLSKLTDSCLTKCSKNIFALFLQNISAAFLTELKRMRFCPTFSIQSTSNLRMDKRCRGSSQIKNLTGDWRISGGDIFTFV